MIPKEAMPGAVSFFFWSVEQGGNQRFARVSNFFHFIGLIVMLTQK